ncbi:MAG: hypothetical protein K8L99_00115 [Anaerolineae bacterium]|nr:hypothetical protein [Anaerolineae bacterium]
MLEELTDIDWNKLGKPDIPNWLRNLASVDKLQRFDAFENLESEIIQVRVFDNEEMLSNVLINNIPLLIVPFLIELVSHDTVKGKHLILYLLEELASYIELDESDPDVQHKARQIREAVCTKVNAYTPLLRSSEKDVRLASVVLLDKCVEAHPEVIELLFERLEVEEEAKIIKALFQLFGRLVITTQSNELKTRYLRITSLTLSSDASLEIRASAALSLVEIMKANASQLAFDTIAESIPSVIDLSVLRRCIKALTYQDTDKSIDTLIKLVTNPKTHEVIICYTLLGIFDLLFNQNMLTTHIVSDSKSFNVKFRPFLTPAYMGFPSASKVQYIVYDPNDPNLAPFANRQSHLSHLTEKQVSTLESLLDIGRIWRFESNVFELYELPNSPNQLRNLVNELK